MYQEFNSLTEGCWLSLRKKFYAANMKYVYKGGNDYIIKYCYTLYPIDFLLFDCDPSLKYFFSFQTVYCL